MVLLLLLLLELVAADHCDDGASETVTAANAISLVMWVFLCVSRSQCLWQFLPFACQTAHCVWARRSRATVTMERAQVCMVYGEWYSLLFRIFKHWVAVVVVVVAVLSVQKATVTGIAVCKRGNAVWYSVCKFRNAFYWFYTVNMPARDRKIPK